MVQPSPMSAREQGHAGKPVHPGKQPVVPCGGLHAAGLRDNAQSLVHQMCQRGVVSYQSVCVPSAFSKKKKEIKLYLQYSLCNILRMIPDMCFSSQADFLPGRIVFLVVAFSFSDM